MEDFMTEMYIEKLEDKLSELEQENAELKQRLWELECMQDREEELNNEKMAGLYFCQF